MNTKGFGKTKGLLSKIFRIISMISFVKSCLNSLAVDTEIIDLSIKSCKMSLVYDIFPFEIYAFICQNYMLKIIAREH